MVTWVEARRLEGAHGGSTTSRPRFLLVDDPPFAILAHGPRRLHAQFSRTRRRVPSGAARWRRGRAVSVTPNSGTSVEYSATHASVTGIDAAPLQVLTVDRRLIVTGGACAAYRWSRRTSASKVWTRKRSALSPRQEGPRGDAGYLRPKSVYAYQAHGTERLSVLRTTSGGAPLPATVTKDTGDCWTLLRIDYDPTIGKATVAALRPDSFDLGERIFQSFDFGVTRNDTNVVTCDPPGEAIRLDARPATCRGRAGRARRHAARTSASVDERLRRRRAAAHRRNGPRCATGDADPSRRDQKGAEDSHVSFGVFDTRMVFVRS